MSVRILIGDVREQLRLLPSESFDCVVTSPPYWGLRDYGIAGQIGLEPSLGEHLDVMVDVFREVRRVLKRHGTLWLNYGDCYAAAPNGKSAAAYKADGTDDRTFRDKPFSTVGAIYQPVSATGGQRGDPKRAAVGEGIPTGRIAAGGLLKPKDLCMIPNRLAIALQDDGWWVRSEIIWHKPNPMPESVYDRPTSAHEKVWLLTKGEEYFYNHEAIREPVARRSAGGETGVGWGKLDRLDPDQTDRGRDRVKTPGPNSRQNVDRVPRSRKIKVPGGWDVGAGSHGTINRAGRTEATYIEIETNAPTSKSGNKTRKLRDQHGGFSGSNSHQGYGIPWEGSTRNARNVWTITPRPFREAHFATFPPALAERCIKAGVPPTVCGCCGSVSGCGPICEAFERVPGRVLDPFGGAGTVGLVAEQLSLDATLIELNPAYAQIAEQRIAGAVPASVAAD